MVAFTKVNFLTVGGEVYCFPTNLFSIAEVKCLFIDIQPCLGSILNVFHKHIINATTTAINKMYLTLVKGR